MKRYIYKLSLLFLFCITNKNSGCPTCIGYPRKKQKAFINLNVKQPAKQPQNNKAPIPIKKGLINENRVE